MQPKSNSGSGQSVTAQTQERPDYLSENADEALVQRRVKKLVDNAKAHWEGNNDAKRKLTDARKRNYQ